MELFLPEVHQTWVFFVEGLGWAVGWWIPGENQRCSPSFFSGCWISESKKLLWNIRTRWHLQTFEIYHDLFPNSSYYKFNFYWYPQSMELSSENPQTFKSTPGNQPTLKGNYVKDLHWLTIKSWGTPMRFVLLRNPWGMLEWRGDWGDLSTFASFIGCWRIILSLMMSHTQIVRWQRHICHHM